jgi:hypothetical protein
VISFDPKIRNDPYSVKIITNQCIIIANYENMRELARFNYKKIFIGNGSMIYSFEAKESMVSYESHIGNNDVPYPTHMLQIIKEIFFC